MKFILNENQFILNESQQFLLEERFRLLEDDKTSPEIETTMKWLQLLLKNVGKDSAVCIKLVAYLKDTINNGPLSPKNVTPPADTLTKIEVAAKDLTTALEAPAFQATNTSIEDLKNELVGIYTKLTNYKNSFDGIAIGDNHKKQLQKIIDTLDTLLKQLPKDSTAAKNIPDKNLPKLVKQVQELPKIAEQTATVLKAAFNTDAAQTKQDKLKAFQKLCIECVGTERTDNNGILLKTEKFKIVKINAGKAKHDARGSVEYEKSQIEKKLKLFPTATLKDYQARISTAVKSVQELPDYPGADKVLANIDTYYAKIETILANFKQVLESAVYADLDTIEKTEQDKQSGKTTTDWKSKLAKAGNKLAVIEEFIYTKWPTEHHDKLLKIKETLLKECEAYGFDSNPFIKFITDVYIKYQIRPELYNVIHNLVVDNLLSINDLRGDGQMGQTNLIRCKELYSKTAGEIKLYIRKQANLLKASNKDPRFQTNADMAYYALYQQVEPAKNKPAKQPPKDTPPTLPLRPINEIERLEDSWTGKISSTSSETENKVVSNETLLNQLSNTEDAVKVVAALVLKFSSDNKIKTRAMSCPEVKKILNKDTTPATLIKLITSVDQKFNTTNITASQALKLIDAILSSDKFNLTTEA